MIESAKTPWASPRVQMYRWTVSYAPKTSPQTVVTVKFISATKREALQSAMELGVPLTAKRDWKFGWLRIDADYRQQFLLALLFNVQSGMSAGKALDEVIQSERGQARQVLEPALEIIKAGGDFSDAIDGLSMFDEATLSILRTGEKLGTMKEAMTSAMAHLKKSSHSMMLMYGALMAIVLDLVIAAVTTFGMQFFQLPKLRSEGISSKDPIVVADFTRSLDWAFLANGALVAITILVSIVVSLVVVAYANKELRDFREKVDRGLHHIPLVRDLLRHTSVSSTMSICSSLLNGGVMLGKALILVRSSTSSPIVAKYWERAETLLEHGEPVGMALQDETLLEHTECRLLLAHKDHLQLGQAMHWISERRDEMATRAQRKFRLFAVTAGIAYASASVVIMMWASYIQYQATMAGSTSIGG